MNNEIYIKKVYSTENEIFIYFSDNTIKVLKKEMLPDNKHTKEIKKSNIWRYVKTNGFCLQWTKYKVFNQPYDAGADVLYEITKKATKDDLITLLSLQARKKPVKQIRQMLASLL